LHRLDGRQKISRFSNNFPRPHVVDLDLAADYAALAGDTERKAEALKGIEGIIGDISEEPSNDGR
jgi:hypothetical protein